MSWFDTTKGLASLAKTALKEAQKQIDKALDIQEENQIIAKSQLSADETKCAAQTMGKKLPGGANRERSKTEPNTPTTKSALINSDTVSKDDSATSSASFSTSNWGSFTGSFFENPKGKEMVTIPPKGSASAEFSTPAAAAPIMGLKRQSVTSNSDSVDLLSPSASPCSELPSPSDTAIQTSESVEVITATTTSEVVTPDLGSSLPESIVIIASSKDDCDDEEESVSYSTVMDEAYVTDAPDALSSSKRQNSSLEDTKDLDTPRSSMTLCNSNSSTSTVKLNASLDEPACESQTVDSDSTQSFEDVQLQTSSTHSSFKDPTLSQTSEEKLEMNLIKMSTQNYSSSQNSNDEMETTTSSDIEIISNPNGDSSSTNSTTRTSPLKLRKSSSQGHAHGGSVVQKKGHYREPSEISILSEDSQSEVEKLLQRISELNEVLEARELRLLESERQNATMQDRLSELQVVMESMKNNSVNMEMGEEYTQRLSVLEKKFQASIRERDALRIQISALKDELQNKIDKNDLTQVVTESNAMITELRLEGEKLSKEILQQSNIIKKLRAKEKTSDALLKKNKEQIDSMTDEVERLKKTLNAKEDVERSQIEAVHKISSEKRKLDEDNQKLRSTIEDLQSKLATLQASFDAVKGELQQRSRLHVDLTRTTEEALAAKKEKDMTKAENREILMQLNELREKLRYSEEIFAKREQQLRDDNKQLLERLEAAELRAEATTQEVSLTTVPLIRQLESLQNTLSQRTTNWNKEESMLLEKLDNAQTRLKSLEAVEAKFKETISMLQARCKDLEEKLSHALMEEQQAKMALQQAQLDYSLKESNLHRQITTLNEKLSTYNDKLQSLEESNANLEQKLKTLEDKKARTAAEDYLHREPSEETLNEVVRLADQQQRPTSPTTSYGKNSLEDAMCGSVDWQADDDCISNAGHHTSMAYGIPVSFMGNNTTTLEHLQSLLKQRDGELSQLQWELSRLQAERNVLNDEITSTSLELENVKDKLQTYSALDSNFTELQHRYDALLQMYGEKVERTEELELDLIELKDAYKTQINELLAQPRHTA